jgi:hypothetical protein
MSRRKKLLLWLGGIPLGLLAVFFSIAYYQGTHVVQRTYTADELGERVVGQVTPLFDGTGVEIWGVIEAPADKVWKVVTDQDRFAEYMPYVETSRISERHADHLVEEQTLDLPMGRFERLKLKIWYESEGNRRTAQWNQLQGTPKINRGAWVVEDHGSRSILRYQVRCDPGQGVPEWFLRFFMKHRLKGIVRAVRARVLEKIRSDPEYFKTS